MTTKGCVGADVQTGLYVLLVIQTYIYKELDYEVVSAKIYVWVCCWWIKQTTKDCVSADRVVRAVGDSNRHRNSLQWWGQK